MEKVVPDKKNNNRMQGIVKNYQNIVNQVPPPMTEHEKKYQQQLSEKK